MAGGPTASLVQLGALAQATRTYSTESDTAPGWFLLFFGLWGVFVLGCYGFGIWALVDTIRHRDDEFTAVGSNRVLWLVLLLVGLIVCQPVGLVAGLVFVVRVRPRLLAWRREHPGMPVTWYAGYPPYGTPPGHPPPPGSPPPGYGSPPPGYGAQQPGYGSPPPGYPPPPGYGPPPVPPPAPPPPGWPGAGAPDPPPPPPPPS